MKKTISVLIPAYNEQAVLAALFERLDALTASVKGYYFEFLFVNDGSRDETLEIIKRYAKTNRRVSYINLSRNFGKEIAMIAGIDHVQGETWLKKKTSQWYYKLLQSSTTIPIQIDTGDFRLLDRRCIDALKQFRESQRNTKAMFSWIGYKKKEIFYDRDPRIAGETKWKYRKLINLAIDGITSFTTAPLRIASVFGLIVSCLAFCYILYLVIRPLFGVPTGAGYSSLMAVILFMGGVQMIFLGIIGEYIGRIFNETKQRPLYLIEEYHQAHDKKQ